MATTDPLNTERLTLVSFTRQMITAEYVSWLNDAEVVRFSEQRHLRHDRISCLKYVRSFESGPNFLWAVLFRPDDSRHVGNISAVVDLQNSRADVSILIGHKAMWGRGIGLEAWGEVCRFLLRDMKLRKVGAGTLEGNLAMRKIMEHSGMVEDGRRRKHSVVGGEEMDMIHAAFFRSPRNTGS